MTSVVHLLLVRNDRSGSAGDVDVAALLAERGCTVVDATIQDAAAWAARDEPPRRLASVQRVVVAGGDGSIGPCAALAVQLGVPLGVVPAGTANDFARAMELPDDPERAAMLACTGERLRAVDVAVLGTDQPFVNVASFGIAPEAARTASHAKRVLGALAYPFGALAAVVRARPVRLEVQVDGRHVFAGRSWQTMVASTGAFGGWADIGVDSEVHGDHQLDVVVVPGDRSARDLVIDAASLGRGVLVERDGVLHVRGARITIRGRGPLRAVVDGERTTLDDGIAAFAVPHGAVQVVVG